MLNGAAWPSVRDLWGGINQMRDNYRRSALSVGLRVCLLCAIECQKLPTTLESRENGGRRHSQQRKYAMRLCIYVLPVPLASAPCARRIAGGLSTRRAINLITGDTFWEPVIGRKPVNQLTGYRFTNLTVRVANVCYQLVAPAQHTTQTQSVGCCCNWLTTPHLLLSRCCDSIVVSAVWLCSGCDSWHSDSPTCCAAWLDS